MSMRFMDGFDYLVAANLNLKWDNSPGWSLTTGVYGKGEALDSGNGNLLTHTLNANYVTGMVGFHIQALALTSNTSLLHKWVDATSGTSQVELRMDLTGAMYFTRNGTTIGSVVAPQYRIGTNQFVWVEAQVVISSTNGVANLYINNNAVLVQSGLDTQASANQWFNQVVLSGANGGLYYDSYHFWDTTVGDVYTYPYGEHIIDTQLANAVGSNTTWLKGGSVINANNYQQVNEANEDGDTTYVKMVASGIGDIDSYNWANLVETSGTIGTIAINTIARIDDAGPHTYAHYALSNSVGNLGSIITPGPSYINEQTFQGTDPNTSAAWTVPGRNAAQFGYEFIS